MKRESVWNYPRPPRLEPVAKRIRVVYENVTIADTHRAQRVLETSHPPVYYIPPADIRMEFLHPSSHKTFCEWKGTASYYTLEINETKSSNAAWTYEHPTAGFESISNYVAFYASRVSACFVGEEQVIAQPGNFYGGWITSDIEM
jgi:uncharacterized protein (DUF427 family)